MARDELALQVKAPPSLERDWINPQIKNESGKKGLRKQEEDKSGSQETRKRKGVIIIPGIFGPRTHSFISDASCKVSSYLCRKILLE